MGDVMIIKNDTGKSHRRMKPFAVMLASYAVIAAMCVVSSISAVAVEITLADLQKLALERNPRLKQWVPKRL